eukprot:5881213-Amphidinium_carterae.1
MSVFRNAWMCWGITPVAGTEVAARLAHSTTVLLLLLLLSDLLWKMPAKTTPVQTCAEADGCHTAESRIVLARGHSKQRQAHCCEQRPSGNVSNNLHDEIPRTVFRNSEAQRRLLCK